MKRVVDYDYAIKAYKAGQNCAAIAKHFNTDESTVRKGLIARGIYLRKYTPKHVLIGRDIFYKLYVEDKLSIGDIAKSLHIARNTVGNALREYRIPARSHPESTRLTFDNGKRKRTYRRTRQDGYVELTIPNYPGSRAYGRVFEHLVVWEKANGRLPRGWVIHHLNGIKDDNRLENLIAFSGRSHSRVENCADYKKRIRQLERKLRNLKRQGKLEVD